MRNWSRPRFGTDKQSPIHPLPLPSGGNSSNDRCPYLFCTNGFKKFFLSPTIPFFHSFGVSGYYYFLLDLQLQVPPGPVLESSPLLVTVSLVTVQKTVKSEKATGGAREKWHGILCRCSSNGATVPGRWVSKCSSPTPSKNLFFYLQ